MSVKIDAAQLVHAELQIRQYGEYLSRCVEQYCETLDAVKSDGYVSQEFTKAVEALEAELSQCKKSIQEACETLDNNSIQFLKDLDTINNEFAFPYRFDDRVSRFFHISF